MPVILDRDLPAFAFLESEGRHVLPKHRWNPKLRIALVNLMPTKIQTETQFARLLSHSTEMVEMVLVQMETHKSENTNCEHLERFYKPSSWLYGKKLDGLILTGAPVELMEFDQVDYWGELVKLLDWIPGNVRSSMFVCWGAQAALHHYFGIGKSLLPKKLFGVFHHDAYKPEHPILTGQEYGLFAPQSRYTENPIDEITANSELEMLSMSGKVGAFISWARKWQMFFISGHPEYDTDTLKKEYERDMLKALDTDMPENYYCNNDPQGQINNVWEQAGRIIYSNWVARFVSPLNTERVFDNPCDVV